MLASDSGFGALLGYHRDSSSLSVVTDERWAVGRRETGLSPRPRGVPASAIALNESGETLLALAVGLIRLLTLVSGEPEDSRGLGLSRIVANRPR